MSKPSYYELMGKRKQLQFQGKNKEALEVQRMAEKMIERGEVSDEEIQTAAYL